MAEEAKKEQDVRETYVVTEEAMAEVNTYVPIRIKTELVDLIADKCLIPSQITASLNGEEMAMPTMYREDSNRKSRYLMGVFVRLYLCGTFDSGDDEDIWLIPEDEYDKWAGGHIFNQIERFKQNPKFKNTCFDMMSDYKDFEKRLNLEVYSYLNAMNDDVARQLAAMQASVTPDSVEGIMEQVKKLQKLEEEIEDGE